MNPPTISLCVKNDILDDIQLLANFPTGANLNLGSELQFLSLVEVSKIPLCLAAGPICNVFTNSERTKKWFTKAFLSTVPPVEENKSSQHEWWQINSRQSVRGVLAQVIESSNDIETKPLITEVLFYGVADTLPSQESHLTPPPSSPYQDAPTTTQEHTIRVQALPLSSHFLNHLSYPPLSPQQSAKKTDAQFLPSVGERQFAAEEVERKRKRVSNVFDEADENRRKVTRKGGSGVAAAASKLDGVRTLIGQKKPKEPIPSRNSSVMNSTEWQRSRSKHERARHSSISGIENLSEISSKRPLSRSPSFSSEARPSSRRGLLDNQNQSKRSSLSRITSLSEAATTEDRNKEAISRFVMAGMRLYGLQQRKNQTHSRSHSEVIPVGAAGTSSDDVAKDEEYKLMYHQTYKSTVFAFRKYIATEALYLTPEPIRETVDKFLAIFCSDPIVPL